jgi:hypothetical protein
MLELTITYCIPHEAVFKEKRGIWNPMLELTITSPYLIVEFKVQPSTPMMRNANECFPNNSKIKLPIRKGRVEGREEIVTKF